MTIDSLDQLKKVACDNFSLYGNGYVSNMIQQYLAYINEIDRLKYIYISNNEYSRNKRVVCIDNVRDNSITTIVATTKRYQGEISEILRAYAFDRILFVSDLFIDELAKYLERNCNFEESPLELEKKIIDSGKRMTKKALNENVYDIQFLQVPYWDVKSPFGAIPSLIAYLRMHNIKVGSYDLGIETFHIYLRKNWRKKSEIYYSRSFFEDKVNTFEGNPYSTYEEYCQSLWFFEDDCFSWDEVKNKYSSLNIVQKGILTSFINRLLEGQGYLNFNTKWSIDDVVNDFEDIAFLYAVLDMIDKHKIASRPKIIGLSVVGTKQFAYACKLATILRKIYQDVVIVMGGSCADYFLNSLYHDKTSIFKYFDYIMIGEGETGWYNLYKCIVKKIISINKVNNLVFADECNKLVFTNQILEDVESLPVPDFSDVDLKRYLLPNTVLPYQASRGCHYGYCAFCNHDAKYRHNYRMKTAKKVVNELLELIKRYNVHYFQFVDEAIRPDHFEQIIAEMERFDEFERVKWFYYSRVSRKYTKELIVRAKRVGCEMVMFGVESYNQRLLNHIKKGITVETSKYCLKLFFENGIKTYEWLMCNLPTETIEEANQDLLDTKSNWKYVSAIGASIFMLDVNTDMYLNPSNFGIISVNNEEPHRFESLHNGATIDKEEMIRVFNQGFLRSISSRYFFSDRYDVFFA